VSPLLEEDVNPVRSGIHRTVFLIYAAPHKHFYDGYIVHIEFNEGSRAHQTIQRIFDMETHAIVQEITQYDILIEAGTSVHLRARFECL
jgi:hypothetical protein